VHFGRPANANAKGGDLPAQAFQQLEQGAVGCFKKGLNADMPVSVPAASPGARRDEHEVVTDLPLLEALQRAEEAVRCTLESERRFAFHEHLQRHAERNESCPAAPSSHVLEPSDKHLLCHSYFQRQDDAKARADLASAQPFSLGTGRDPEADGSHIRRSPPREICSEEGAARPERAETRLFAGGRGGGGRGGEEFNQISRGAAGRLPGVRDSPMHHGGGDEGDDSTVVLSSSVPASPQETVAEVEVDVDVDVEVDDGELQNQILVLLSELQRKTSQARAGVSPCASSLWCLTGLLWCS